MTWRWARALGVSLAVVAGGCVNDVELVHPPATAVTSAPRWRAVLSGTSRDLRRVWGAGARDVWAVGAGGTAIHWDGAGWAAVETGTNATLTGLWGSAADDVWAVGAAPPGTAGMIHWDGARWSPVELSLRERLVLRAVWGASADEVWAVGGANDAPGPNVWHRTASGWRPELMPGSRPPLSGVAVRETNQVWAVGQGPLVFRRAGGEWAPPVASPRGAQLGGELCAVGDGQLWVTGATDVVYRLAGEAWVSFPLPAGAALRGLWCGAVDVWGVGDGGRVAHWDGAAWSVETVGGGDLAAIWDSGTGERWAVGASGTTLRLGL
jgi:hypothetical protein